MKKMTQQIHTILLADDDPDDRMLTKEAISEIECNAELRFVENGEELLKYLLRQEPYSDPKISPKPELILLDLNMPRMDGREALKLIKSHDQLKSIPIVVLTTSTAEEDIVRSYDLGVNSFITKPIAFEAMVEIMSTLTKYWFDLVSLPARRQNP